MEIKYAQSKGKLYIYLNGELDEYTAGRAKSEIENAIASSGNINASFLILRIPRLWTARESASCSGDIKP